MLVAKYWTQCGIDQMILKKKKPGQRGDERGGVSTISQPNFYPSPSSILIHVSVIMVPSGEIDKSQFPFYPFRLLFKFRLISSSE